MWSWLNANKEWVFSGVGVAILTGVAAVLLKKRSLSQNQQSGNNSMNIQAGGNINLNAKDEKNDA